MRADETQTLWMGWIGTDWSTADGYYSASALANTTDTFHATLLVE